jgi:uncharacterized repeat protein (TIGR03803 family)
MNSPSGLVAMGGALYGAGGGGESDAGCVYAITAGGDIQIVHSFHEKNQRNGAGPSGRLIAVNGLLYGTTAGGGLTHGGYGLIYSVSPSDTFNVLYRFKGPPDGSTPTAGISDAKGTFYGTTAAGGTTCYRYKCQREYGTVFRLER